MLTWSDRSHCQLIRQCSAHPYVSIHPYMYPLIKHSLVQVKPLIQIHPPIQTRSVVHIHSILQHNPLCLDPVVRSHLPTHSHAATHSNYSKSIWVSGRVNDFEWCMIIVILQSVLQHKEHLLETYDNLVASIVI